MTLTIELTPEQEAALQAQASVAGVEASEFARRLLASDLAEPPLPQTGAGLTLATLNVRRFRHIPGLTFVRPNVK